MACPPIVRAILTASCLLAGAWVVTPGHAAEPRSESPAIQPPGQPPGPPPGPAAVAGRRAAAVPTPGAATPATPGPATVATPGPTAVPSPAPTPGPTAGPTAVTTPGSAAATAPGSAAAAAQGAVQGVDVIGVETGGSPGITVRMGEDLASLIDDGATRRMVALVGRGGVQNIADLLEGREVDMAFLQLDVLDFARTQKLFPNIETRITYVTKLNYVEFHLLARSPVASVADLAGQVVNVGPTFGDTSITAAQLFKLLKLSLVPGNDEPGLAIEKLRRSEIGAVAWVGGKPSPLFRLSDTNGLHLIPVPLTPDVLSAYIPSQLNATDYPGLVAPDAPVDTIAVGTGLFVDRSRPGPTNIVNSPVSSIRSSRSSRHCRLLGITRNGPRSASPARSPDGSDFPPPTSG